MDIQEQLSKAIHLAIDIHQHQYDKGGNPYILHPLHLMSQLLFDTQLATIAVLHDVVEDSDMTLPTLLRMGFSDRVIDALRLLTHDSNDTYMTYIENMEHNYDAIRVKRKDLEHNSDVTRLKNRISITASDTARIVKYHRAFMKLGEFKKKFM